MKQMPKSQRKSRRAVTRERLANLFSVRFFATVLIGSLFAVLAFSQSAAAVGLQIATFRPLGGAFFSQRAAQQAMALSAIGQGEERTPTQIIALGRSSLEYAPLSTRALWLVGQGFDAEGATEKARAVMAQAQRISRRDSAVELWLGVDNLKRSNASEGLRNFDLMIRTNSRAAEVVTPMLAQLIEDPEGRRVILPYFVESNPWLADLMWSAVTTRPKAAPLAEVLLARSEKLPDGPKFRRIYELLFQKLVDEKAYALAIRLYPRLPATDLESMRTLDTVKEGKLIQGYAPFIWSFPTEGPQNGAAVAVQGEGIGLDLSAAPGTVGIAASKLVIPPEGSAIEWKVSERSENTQGDARLIASCRFGVAAGKKRQSIDLMSAAAPLGKSIRMAPPSPCSLLAVEIQMSGGIGREAAELVITGAKLVPKPAR